MNVLEGPAGKRGSLDRRALLREWPKGGGGGGGEPPDNISVFHGGPLASPLPEYHLYTDFLPLPFVGIN